MYLFVPMKYGPIHDRNQMNLYFLIVIYYFMIPTYYGKFVNILVELSIFQRCIFDILCGDISCKQKLLTAMT